MPLVLYIIKVIPQEDMVQDKMQSVTLRKDKENQAKQTCDYQTCIMKNVIMPGHIHRVITVLRSRHIKKVGLGQPCALVLEVTCLLQKNLIDSFKGFFWNNSATKSFILIIKIDGNVGENIV